jgi:hypothetical protein
MNECSGVLRVCDGSVIFCIHLARENGELVFAFMFFTFPRHSFGDRMMLLGKGRVGGEYL